MSSDLLLLLCWNDTSTSDGNFTRAYFNITTDEWNLEYCGRCEACPPLKADPDIAGVGVVITFIILAVLTAWLATSLPTIVLLHGLLQNKQIQKWVNTAFKHTANGWVITSVAGRLERLLSGQHGARCARISYDMVIALSDQQLATAIALLIAAIKKLHIDKDISIYHFDLVVSSAFLNSTVFTCATFSYHFMVTWEEAKKSKLPLLSIRTEPDLSERQLQQETPWIMRMILIVTLNGLLVYGGSVSGRTQQLPVECPAFCFRNTRPGSKLSTTTFRLGYWFWPGLILSNIFNYWHLAMVYKWWLPRIHLGSTVVSITQRFPRNMFLFFKGFYLYQIIAGYVALLALVWRIKPQFEEEPGAEDSMGFGQIVPLFLLILLLVQFINSISVHYGNTKDEETSLVRRKTL